MTGTRIELCGALRIEVDGVQRRIAGRQARLVFAYLALEPEHAVAREELIGVLWPERAPRDAPAVLSTLLSRLRSTLAPAALEGRAEVRLHLPEPVWIDVIVAEDAVGRARALLDQGDHLAAWQAAQSASRTLRRALLPGETGEWLETRRRELENLRCEALECEALAGSHLGGAQRARAVRAASELAVRAPFRESGYAALMQAHASSDNVAEALRAYAELRDRLRRELGTAPGGELAAFYERLVAGRDRYSTKAAAYGGSPGLLRRALDAAGQTSEPDAVLRCELLLELGASHERAGDGKQAREAFADAAAVARQLGHRDFLGAAALGYGGRGIPFAPGVVDESLVALLEEALDAFGDARALLKVRLLARLATALWSPGDLERRRALADEAVGLARELGDPSTLAFALSAHHLAAWGPDNLEDRQAAAREVIRLASVSGDVEAALPGHLSLFTDRFEAGDLAGADRELEAYGRLADELGRPEYLWWEALLRGLRHFLAGRFADAENAAGRVLTLAPRSVDEVAQQFVIAHVAAVRKEANQLPQLGATLRAMIDRYPGIPAWRCFLAYLYAEDGQLDAAQAEFGPLMTGLSSLPRDMFWVISLGLLAAVAAVLDDVSAAGILYRHLLPHSGRAIVVLGGLWLGPVDHLLALLARTRRDYETAERHFDGAQSMIRRMGARPWLGHNLRERAAGLIMRNEPGDKDRALAFLDEAQGIADDLGMDDLRRWVDHVRGAARSDDSLTRLTGRVAGRQA